MTPRVFLPLLLLAPAALGAQDSHFSIHGLGTPERWESVRARTMGGAFALFDPLSPTADAALALLNQLSASAAGVAGYRSVDLGGDRASLRSTRFPLVTLAGPILPRVAVGGGFNTYLNRSYRVATRDTVVLRGEPQAVTDDVTSEGGVTDVRIAAAWGVSSRVRIGASLHALTGSTRVTVIRRFDDSVRYQPVGEVDQPRYDGVGGSAGAQIELGRALQVAGFLRADTRLRYKTRDTTGSYDLPITWGAALRWQPGPRAIFAGAVQSSSWGSAQGLGGHDTFAWSAGAELGGAGTPLRLGIRGGDLPFGPAGAKPTELAGALGLGFRFSGGRGLVDVGVERVQRKADGLKESAWVLLVGITVRP